MRVLHVTEALGGGVQSAIVNYVRGVPEAEHSLFSRARDGQGTHGLPDAIAHEGYRGGLVGFFTRMRQKVREESPDVIHLHSSVGGAARAVLGSGPGIVYSPHCYALERTDVSAPERWSYEAIERLLARRRQVIVAVSPREAELSLRLNRRNPVEVAHNPTPFAHVTRAAADRDIVVMVGRLSPQKAPERFAAVARLAHRGTFVWIGDGDADSRAELESAGVQVTGWLPPEEVQAWLRRAALYLHTAAWEGGPVSTIEAAALDVPVLARSIPSMASLGYALAGGTDAEMAASVDAFFDDESYRDEVAQAGRYVVRNSSHDAMSASLRAAYDLARTQTASSGAVGETVGLRR